MLYFKKLKWNLKKLSNIPQSTYLCIRFPFLYPRNRWTDKHYNNWELNDKIGEVYKKYPKFEYSGGVDLEGWLKKRQLPQPFKIKLWLFILERYRNILELFHCLPTYTELDAMPSGWRKAFGIQICKEIKQSLKHNNQLYSYRITQIKEKWGYLHWYDYGAPEEVHDIIFKYEYISGYTCINCGRPARYITSGWISPYCEDCAPNGTKECEKFYGYTKTKYRIKGSDKTFEYEKDGE